MQPHVSVTLHPPASLVSQANESVCMFFWHDVHVKICHRQLNRVCPTSVLRSSSPPPFAHCLIDMPVLSCMIKNHLMEHKHPSDVIFFSVEIKLLKSKKGIVCDSSSGITCLFSLSVEWQLGAFLLKSSKKERNWFMTVLSSFGSDNHLKVQLRAVSPEDDLWVVTGCWNHLLLFHVMLHFPLNHTAGICCWCTLGHVTPSICSPITLEEY